MPAPSLFILYVDNPPASTAFYVDLLGISPVETSPTFAMFVLATGVKLGLWSRHTVEPPVDGIGTAGEIAFAVPSEEVVLQTHLSWKAKGLAILQAPVAMDFGHTFTALDPDGHRLRVYAPSAD